MGGKGQPGTPLSTPKNAKALILNTASVQQDLEGSLRCRAGAGESDGRPRILSHLNDACACLFLPSGPHGVGAVVKEGLEQRCFLSRTIDEALLRCICQLLHTGTSEGTRLTFKKPVTSRAHSLFIQPGTLPVPSIHVFSSELIILSAPFFF